MRHETQHGKAGVASGGAWSAAEKAAILSQLDSLLASLPLRNAARQQRLLRYIVEATLADARDRLKAFTLAVEVFDRGSDFDPNVDSIVRVEAGRLRAKLLEYYVGDGAGDPVVIELPKGGYAASFAFRAPRPEAGAESPSAGLAERDRPSIAVIPFANMSGDGEQEYFADGITEDLITGLSRLSGLFVISRHSAFAYKRSTRRIEEIGAELGVRYVLEGSVRRQGETLRITAQLVDARSGGHLWAQRYDRPMHDVFAVQDDVSTKIVGALAVALTPLEHARFGHEGTASLAAYDQLLRGLERFWIYTPAANAEAQAFFRQALALDPEFAAAHAWLARSLLFDYIMQLNGGKCEILESACHHARTAVNLDGLLPHALAVLCWAELWARSGEDAIRAGRRAVALDSNNADARMFLSIALWTSGQGQEALQHIDLAMQLNPHPSALQFWAHGAALLVVGRDEEALADLQESFRLRAGFLPSLTFAVWACVNLNRLDDARRYCEEIAALSGSSDIPLRRIWLNSELDRRCAQALLRAGMTQSPTA